MNQGFSLTEVLVSLILLMSTSLVLIKQQCHVSHLLNQSPFPSTVLSQLDNKSERKNGRFVRQHERFHKLVLM
jgi:Tfp pilus assembly protein PilV